MKGRGQEETSGTRFVRSVWLETQKTKQNRTKQNKTKRRVAFATNDIIPGVLFSGAFTAGEHCKNQKVQYVRKNNERFGYEHQNGRAVKRQDLTTIISLEGAVSQLI